MAIQLPSRSNIIFAALTMWSWPPLPTMTVPRGTFLALRMSVDMARSFILTLIVRPSERRPHDLVHRRTGRG